MDHGTLPRRDFLRASFGSSLAISWPQHLACGKENDVPAPILGLVIVPENLSLDNWPRRAKDAGLNTISLHHWESPEALCDFVATDAGQTFLQQCKDAGIGLEFDFHAMRDLVPRVLFAKDPSLFCMNEKGDRTAERNFCVHPKAAIELAAENALAYAEKLPTTTNCDYYWSDGCAAWCRCPRCRDLSDSDQPLVVENFLAGALRRTRPEAQVAHLACHSSMPRPTKIKPAPGVFLQFAPGRRRHDVPYSQQRDEKQVDSLWFLERNLDVFPADSAQVLEYWLDVTHFGDGKGPLPRNRHRFLEDLGTYRSLGVNHIRSFGNGIDANYVQRHRDLGFLQEFAGGLKNWP